MGAPIAGCRQPAAFDLGRLTRSHRDADSRGLHCPSAVRKWRPWRQATCLLALVPRRFGGFASARDNVSLNRPHLDWVEDLLERRHAERCAVPAQNDVFDSFESVSVGVAETGQRAGHRVDAVTTRAVGIEKQAALMHHSRRNANAEDRRGRLLVAECWGIQSCRSAKLEGKNPAIPGPDWA